MSLFEKIAKRASFPVEINGGQIYVAEPTYGEIARVAKLHGDLRTGLSLALCIVNGDGKKALTPADSESDESLADRALVEMDDITPSMLTIIMDAIERLSKRPSSEKLEKN